MALCASAHSFLSASVVLFCLQITVSLPVPCLRDLTLQEKADILVNRNGSIVDETRSYTDLFKVNQFLDQYRCDDQNNDWLCPTRPLIDTMLDYFPQSFDDMTVCLCQGARCRFPESTAWGLIPWVRDYTCVQNMRSEVRLRLENTCDPTRENAQKWQLVRMQLPAGCSCALRSSLSDSVVTTTPPPPPPPPTAACSCTVEQTENGNCPCLW